MRKGHMGKYHALGSGESSFLERLEIHGGLSFSGLLCSEYRQVRLEYIFRCNPHESLIAMGNGRKERVR